jgi:SGF29 tudor-like domain
VIHLASVSCKLSKSDEVLAVYPDTTSFYRAVITQPPRRNVQSQGSASVQFAVSSSSTIATYASLYWYDTGVCIEYLLFWYFDKIWKVEPSCARRPRSVLLFAVVVCLLMLMYLRKQSQQHSVFSSPHAPLPHHNSLCPQHHMYYASSSYFCYALSHYSLQVPLTECAV